jgi:hypothetical protein
LLDAEQWAAIHRLIDASRGHGRRHDAPRMTHPRVIRIHRDAPAKPAPGSACNGCGVCCLAEPCPLGMLLSRRIVGACAALRWSEAPRRYECGALTSVGRSGLLRRVAALAIRRWIGAGRGCDSFTTTTRA